MACSQLLTLLVPLSPHLLNHVSLEFPSSSEIHFWRDYSVGDLEWICWPWLPVTLTDSGDSVLYLQWHVSKGF